MMPIKMQKTANKRIIVLLTSSSSFAPRPFKYCLMALGLSSVRCPKTLRKKTPNWTPQKCIYLRFVTCQSKIRNPLNVEFTGSCVVIRLFKVEMEGFEPYPYYYVYQYLTILNLEALAILHCPPCGVLRYTSLLCKYSVFLREKQ